MKHFCWEKLAALGIVTAMKAKRKLGTEKDNDDKKMAAVVPSEKLRDQNK